jgi:hypothetical protein
MFRVRAVSSLECAIFHVQKEVIMKKKIGFVVLGAALTFGMSAGAWAQGGGAGGASGGAAGAGVGVNSSGSTVGGRGTTTVPSPNLNPSSPNTVPQASQTPVSPRTSGTSTENGTHRFLGQSS